MERFATPHWSATGFVADKDAVTPNRPPNILLLRLVALASFLAAVSAVIAMVITGQAGAWLTFAFQGTIVLAGVLGVLQGLGKFGDAPSLGTLCVAGTLFVAGFLGYLGAGGNMSFRSLLSGSLDALNAGKLPTWVLLVEIGSASVLGAISGLLALGRSPGASWRQLALVVALGAPVVIGVVAGEKLHLAHRIASQNMIVSTLAVVGLFALFVGLVAASANAIIKAFAAGLPDLDALGADPATPADAKPNANTAGTD